MIIYPKNKQIKKYNFNNLKKDTTNISHGYHLDAYDGIRKLFTIDLKDFKKRSGDSAWGKCFNACRLICSNSGDVKKGAGIVMIEEMSGQEIEIFIFDGEKWEEVAR